MKICGIIAEYDPFHKGHAYHIQEAKKTSGADFIICVMSTSFTQRGMPALLSAHDRAEMALRCGADVVLGVPYAFSVCDAEKFALGGVEILRKTGVVDTLSFGIERDGLNHFIKAAELLENPDEAYLSALKQGLNNGLTFAKAQGEALSKALCVDANIFALPNTSLAVCYARACRKTKADFLFAPVIRSGDYHADKLDAKFLPSASAVRQALSEGDTEAVRKAMPEDAYRILLRAKEENRLQKYTPLDSVLRYKLCGENLSSLPDLSEGIENRFRDAANESNRNDMVLSIKSKRYTYARINRLLSHLLVGANAADIPVLPDYAYLLGFREAAAPLLHRIGESELNLLHRLPSDTLSPMQALDRRADDMWAIGAENKFGYLYRAKPVIIRA